MTLARLRFIHITRSQICAHLRASGEHRLPACCRRQLADDFHALQEMHSSRPFAACPPLGRKFLRGRALQSKTESRSIQCWLQCASNGLSDAVENHSLDADVVVKIFGMPQRRDSATDVKVQRRRAV